MTLHYDKETSSEWGSTQGHSMILCSCGAVVWDMQAHEEHENPYDPEEY